MKSLTVILAVLILTGSGLKIAIDPDNTNIVLRIGLNSEITLATTIMLQDAIDLAQVQKARLVIITLNTAGGEVEAVQNIMNLLENSNVTVCVFVYPPGATAWSGGTYVLMSSHVAAMSSGTTIGSCQPVLSTGEPINQSKYVNALTALMVNHAGLHDRNETMAKLFVTENANLGPEEALRFHVIEFIADDIYALLKKLEGFTLVRFEKTLGSKAWRLVPNDEAQDYPSRVSFGKISEARIVEYAPGVQSVLLNILLNPLISSLLLIAGIFLLFIGIKTPGFGAELAGTLFIVLALIALRVVGISLGAIILFVIGAFLIIAELKVHIGILALSGAACIVIASLLLFPSPQWLIYQGIIQQIQEVILIAAVSMAALFSFIVYKAAKARRSRVRTGKEALMGAKGLAVSDLKPKGEVRVVGEFWQAKAMDGWISKGEEIEVVGLDGLFLIVKPLERKV
ncbi:MAG: NfeD family protein [Candidatus Bathyarchaeia archaeon]